MSIAENKLHPLEIQEARQAAHAASEKQRDVEDQIKRDARNLADRERIYRQALARKILDLRTGTDKPAWTVCDDLARGDEHVARLRYERDVAEGMLEATKQQAFRRGADRKDVHELIRWSMARDLRVDTPPAEFARPVLEPAA